jgi:hypothetical protein
MLLLRLLLVLRLGTLLHGSSRLPHIASPCRLGHSIDWRVSSIR